MRVVFLGTPEFAIPSLVRLVGSTYEVAAVVTQPDRRAGRGQHPTPPPVKVLALERGLPLHQPERIRDEANRPILEALRPDFLVVVAYGQILPRWLLELPAVAPVNVHASLLPRYRGAAPVAWALLNGERTTGVTTMLMEPTLDTGPMLLARSVPIDLDATCGDLERTLAELGAELLLPTLDGMAAGRLQPRPQDERLAVAAPRITKEMAPIAWDRRAAEIHDRVRALNPWPLAATGFRGQRLRVLRTRAAEAAAGTAAGPGTLLGFTAEGIVLACGESTALEIVEVQLPGRRPVSGRAFANGAHLAPGAGPFEPPPG
jgi:methionyl-tRNA formyltransferase